MKKNKWFIFTILWMFLIFWFSNQDATNSTIQSNFFLKLFPFLPVFIIRKAAHMTLYAILGFFVYHCFEKAKISKVLFVCFLYACSDEFHQLFIPGRSGQFSDVCIDLCGTCIGLVLFLSIKKAVTKRLS